MDDMNRPADDPRLRKLLALPQAPANLRARLRASLDAAPARGARRRVLARCGVAALVGAVVAALVLLAPTRAPAPTVVVAAYQDMLKDRGLRGIRDNEHALWLARNDIREPAGVELSKRCTLGTLRARHLRVNAGAGPVNLFLYAASHRPAQRRVAQGEFKDQRWLLLEPRPGMTIIALYDAAQPPETIARLVSEMFPAARPA